MRRMCSSQNHLTCRGRETYANNDLSAGDEHFVLITKGEKWEIMF